MPIRNAHRVGDWLDVAPDAACLDVANRGLMDTIVFGYGALWSPIRSDGQDFWFRQLPRGAPLDLFVRAVVSLCAKAKVVWINATWEIAGVHNNIITRGEPVMDFIGNPMCPLGFPTPPEATGPFGKGAACVDNTTKPRPAPVFIRVAAFFKKSYNIKTILKAAFLPLEVVGAHGYWRFISFMESSHNYPLSMSVGNGSTRGAVCQ